jgi:hypothetical protein
MTRVNMVLVEFNEIKNDINNYLNYLNYLNNKYLNKYK